MMSALLLSVGACFAATLSGPTIELATTKAGTQANPQVAYMTSSNVVSVWEHTAANGTFEVRGQIMLTTGVSSGSEFIIVANLAAAPQAVVSSLEAGGFVVVWRGADADSTGILVRRYDSAGVALEEAHTVNTVTAGAQDQPRVAGLQIGGYVVVWRSADADQNGVFVRQFDYLGAASGGEVAVNDVTASEQSYPAVASLSTGFVVVWQSLQQDGSDEGIIAQAFSVGSGAPTKSGVEFIANLGATSRAQRFPRVVGLANGAFVVVWETLTETNGYEISGQKFASDLSPSGIFSVNTHTADHQTRPAISALGDEEFVVVWESAGQDGSGSGVRGQVFSVPSTGAPTVLGGEFAVNQETTGDQTVPSVAELGFGSSFIVAFQSNGGTNDDGTDCKAQRLEPVATPSPANHVTVRFRTQGAAANLDGTSTFAVKLLFEGGAECAVGAFTNPSITAVRYMTATSCTESPDKVRSVEIDNMGSTWWVQSLEVLMADGQTWSSFVTPIVDYYVSKPVYEAFATGETPVPQTHAPSATLRMRTETLRGSSGSFLVRVDYTDTTSEVVGKFEAPAVGVQDWTFTTSGRTIADVTKVTVYNGGAIGWQIRRLQVQDINGAYQAWVLPLHDNRERIWIDGDNPDVATYLEFEPRPNQALDGSSPTVHLRIQSGSKGSTSNFLVDFIDGTTAHAIGSVDAPAANTPITLSFKSPKPLSQLTGIRVRGLEDDAWVIKSLEAKDESDPSYTLLATSDPQVPYALVDGLTLAVGASKEVTFIPRTNPVQPAWETLALRITTDPTSAPFTYGFFSVKVVTASAAYFAEDLIVTPQPGNTLAYTTQTPFAAADITAIEFHAPDPTGLTWKILKVERQESGVYSTLLTSGSETADLSHGVLFSDRSVSYSKP
eukprot:TRINITY_DN14182_c0_g2_i2.p1 TRINITY_DN14182_c0_g2~~TRINITY_DN14182_c0_g2_i2.p1  ORF type:complete len:896 (+),score=319.74 TRINITY_DN14182_c0_g2_i2:1470-4157(+)